MQNIIDTAESNPQFSTLMTAVKAAHLEDTLNGEGPFTVFAPTNEAFKKLPPDTLTAVLADHDKLTSILTYHVVPGKVMSVDVMKLKEAKTIEGRMLAVDVTDGVKINDAKVLSADIECGNGVIHVVDTVLMPV